MKCYVYSGELAANCSVNITCHGTFEANSFPQALKIANTNRDHKGYQRWQFGLEHEDLYVQAIHDNLRYGIFICDGEYSGTNIIWQDKHATPTFFKKEKR